MPDTPLHSDAHAAVPTPLPPRWLIALLLLLWLGWIGFLVWAGRNDWSQTRPLPELNAVPTGKAPAP